MTESYKLQHKLLKDIVLNYNSKELCKIIEDKNEFGAVQLLHQATAKASCSSMNP